MSRSFHFISGLPRSGSTLLCAILRQNPRFSARITSPAASLCLALIPKMSAAGEFGPFFDNARRRGILRAVIEAYHSDQPSSEVVFDTNRTWSGKASLLADLYPDMRIVCCVRPIGLIIDSIERMFRQNPLEVARFVNAKAGSNIYSRVEALMNSETGLVGSAWSHLRELWFGDQANRMLLVDYESFIKRPEGAIRSLYEALGETAFKHDFENVIYDEPAYDTELGMPGLHRVKPRVEFSPRQLCIPPDIVAKYAESDFWRTVHRRKDGRGPNIIC